MRIFEGEQAPKVLVMSGEDYEHLKNVLVWAALYDIERNNNKNAHVYERVLAATGVEDEVRREMDDKEAQAPRSPVL